MKKKQFYPFSEHFEIWAQKPSMTERVNKRTENGCCDTGFLGGCGGTISLIFRTDQIAENSKSTYF